MISLSTGINLYSSHPVWASAGDAVASPCQFTNAAAFKRAGPPGEAQARLPEPRGYVELPPPSPPHYGGARSVHTPRWKPRSFRGPHAALLKLVRPGAAYGWVPSVKGLDTSELEPALYVRSVLVRGITGLRSGPLTLLGKVDRWENRRAIEAGYIYIYIYIPYVS